MLLWAGCATTESQKHTGLEEQLPVQITAGSASDPMTPDVNVVRSTFEDDCRQLQQFIRSEYHVPGVKEIYIVLKEDNKTAYKDKVLADYILERMKKCLNESGNIKLLPVGDSRMAAVVSLYVVPDFREDFQILITLIDAKSRSIVYAQSTFRNPEDFNCEALAEYRRNYESVQDAEMAYLLIRGINKGEALKEQDRYVKYGKWGHSSSGNYSRSYDRSSGSYGSKGGGEYFQGTVKGGFSSWYPAEQMCVVNDEEHEMTPDKLFYNGRITAGKVRISCSFKEGYYNADTRSETATNPHEKSILIDLPKGYKAMVEVMMHFDGGDYEDGSKDITFKVRKMPAVEEY